MKKDLAELMRGYLLGKAGDEWGKLILGEALFGWLNIWVSYWGCLGLFNVPMGDIGSRKQWEQYKQACLQQCCKEDIFYNKRLPICPFFILPCSLYLFTFSHFILYACKSRCYFKNNCWLICTGKEKCL